MEAKPRKRFASKWAGESVRNVVTRSGGMPRGHFPSVKNGRMVAYEQMLERDACLLFEMSPLIRAYREQPEQIWFPDHDRSRRYTPDYLLDLPGNRSMLVEIKPSHVLRKPEIRKKFDHVLEHMARQGKPFVILTGDEIRRQPRLNNLRLLWRDAPVRFPTADTLRRSLHTLHQSGVETLGDMHAVVGREITFSLLSQGLASCPLENSINASTPITLFQENDHAWFCIDEKSGF
jgi:hypothetical protein